MQKNIADYLPYYIGQDVIHPIDKAPFKLIGLYTRTAPILQSSSGNSVHDISKTCIVRVDEMKLLLRPLSDMEDHEADNFQSVFKWAKMAKPWEGILFNAEGFHYLLKQGFDLFGLIEANLAVDKTKEA